MPAITLLLLTYLPFALPVLLGFVLLAVFAKPPRRAHPSTVEPLGGPLLVAAGLMLWAGTVAVVLWSFLPIAGAFMGVTTRGGFAILSYYPRFVSAPLLAAFALVLIAQVLAGLAVGSARPPARVVAFRRFVLVPAGVLYTATVVLVTAWGFLAALD